MKNTRLTAIVALLAFLAAPAFLSVARAEEPATNTPPAGFTALFNGKDLTGWKGLVGNPKTRAAMTPEQMAAAQEKSDAELAKHWRVENGEVVNDGGGPYLCTTKKYGDFEMWVDWKIQPKGDSGIYIRGTPQVQIWDPFNTPGAKAGSGGLYNNKKNPHDPLEVADKPVGEWNTFYIRMVGDLVTVKFNGKLVVDNVPLENYWEHDRPIYPCEQIELQTHGGQTRFRNLYIREIPVEESNKFLASLSEEGFQPIFNGKDLDGWQGSVDGYFVENGVLICDPKKGGMILTKKEYTDFAVRFEFKVPPGGNNGLAIRTSPGQHAATDGFEIQVLDDLAEKHAKLQPWQYCSSIYGVVPAFRGYTRPVGEWNYEEVIAQGPHITVKLNGTVVVDADLSKIEKTPDGHDHPGLKRASGCIGFLGHGDRVEFRNVRVKALDAK